MLTGEIGVKVAMTRHQNAREISLMLFLVALLSLAPYSAGAIDGGKGTDDMASKLKPATGWMKSGQQSNYEMGLDEDVQHNGTTACCIRSKSSDAAGFATLMKMVDAGEHRGKRVRMTVWTKSKDVAGWAGGWLRVDGASKGGSLAFDNMQDRPIKGSSDWTKQQIVLDVADDATKLAYGVLLNGAGSVWMDDCVFEDVDKSVGLTGERQKEHVFPLPPGWIRAGSHPNQYDMGVDASEKRVGTKCGIIRSNTEHADGFGTLMQMCDAGKFRGKRVKLTAWTKHKDVEGWAGLWMRVDGQKDQRPLSFDNMQDRPIKGSGDWAVHEIVLDVPEESTNIAFGVLLDGTGTVWMDDFKFDVVDKSVGTTDRQQKSQPSNLNFED
jgi:hypothetical protein